MATYLTVPQAAKLLQISEFTTREHLKSGKLPGRKIGKCWRLVEEDLREFLRSGNTNDQKGE